MMYVRTFFAKQNIQFFVLAVFLLLMPHAHAYAARIYVDTIRDEYHPGDTFVATVKVNNEEECINAVDVSFAYNPEVLSAVDFGKGESLITLWVKEPDIDLGSGTVRFAGGIPGGYCGRIAGDPGPSNILGKLVFTVNANASDAITEITINDTSEVLLNDGRGTPALLDTSGRTLSITQSSEQPRNEWIDEVKNDTIAPQDFKIELAVDARSFNGKFFIVFSTNDKQSGIDHFEVLETDPNKYGYEINSSKEAHWVRAESPYVLKDQTLSSRIMVRAMDKAGNERIASLLPPDGNSIASTVLITVGILIAAVIVMRKQKNNMRKIYKRRLTEENFEDKNVADAQTHDMEEAMEHDAGDRDRGHIT